MCFGLVVIVIVVVVVVVVVVNHDPPAGWQECPTDIWTACYSRLLRQIRAPPTTRWAQNDESHILEYLYDMDWNQ